MIDDPYYHLARLLTDTKLFFKELAKYTFSKLHFSFIKFETHKGAFVTTLYRQRGKMARRLMHTGMAGLAAVGMAIAPIIAQEFPGRSVNPWEIPTSTAVLAAATEDSTETIISDRDYRDQTIEYTVVEGDTVASIAAKFDVSTDTIRWENDLSNKDAIKVGQKLRILPVTGVSHKVGKGDTVYSIAKKYDTEAQAIVNFPFNTFVNDETFELAIGQTIIVPDGVMPAETPWAPTARVRQITPDAGTVVASGNFVWPTTGTITQRFVWYHRGLDIANRGGPAVLAADSGKVTTAGWIDNSGYGIRVVIDHGNGMRTLYAHLSKAYVVPGQTVSRGAQIGKMGSTGRSTGTHLHFEIYKNGVALNPQSLLK